MPLKLRVEDFLFFFKIIMREAYIFCKGLLLNQHISVVFLFVFFLLNFKDRVIKQYLIVWSEKAYFHLSHQQQSFCYIL